MTFVLILLLLACIVIFLIALALRRRGPIAERFLLAPYRWIRSTDELWWTSNEHRMSLVGQAWYKAYLKFPTEKLSSLPRRIFVNESTVVVLHPILEAWDRDESLVRLKLEAYLDPEHFRKVRDDRPRMREYAFVQLTEQTLAARPAEPGLTHLSAELLATTFDVSGDTRQRHSVDVPNPSFIWAISAKDSGIHQIAIVFRLESADGGKSITLGMLEHTVKAVVFGPLTKRQLNITLVLSALGTIATAVQFLRSLGVLK